MIESAHGRNFWSGTRILKIFVGSATVADDEDSARIAELEKAAMLDELLTSLRMLEELFSSLREFEELKAIHEELEDSGSGPE